MSRNALQRTLRFANAAARQAARSAGLAAALLLTACRTAPPPDAPASAPTAVVAAAASPPLVAAAPKPSLAEEQRRLAALFSGTPVGFALQQDGSLRVNIPLRYCFDAGQFAVKPPLAAVLEHLAMSQEDGSSHIAVSVPADSAPRHNAPRRAVSGQREHLRHQRALSVQEFLSDKGIADSRMSIAVPANRTATRIVVSVVVTDGPEP